MGGEFSTAKDAGKQGTEKKRTKAEVAKKVTRLSVSRYQDLYAPPGVNRLTLIFYLGVTLLLYFGWHIRDRHIITPEYGIGYVLGVTGGLMMLTLVLYPLRKRMKFMEKFGSNKFWFWIHMVCGVLGPALVVLHSNFNLGSLNSRVVMASTLLVCISGIIGLYIYRRIHFSLYGRRLTLEELKEQYGENTNSLVVLFNYAPRLQEHLQEIETRLLSPPTSFLESVIRLLTIGPRIRWTHAILLIRLKKALNRKAEEAGWNYEEKERVGNIARRYISAHMNAAIKIAEFTFFERIFALWYLLHFPLFILLIIAGVIHVVAVHLY